MGATISLCFRHSPAIPRNSKPRARAVPAPGRILEHQSSNPHHASQYPLMPHAHLPAHLSSTPYITRPFNRSSFALPASSQALAALEEQQPAGRVTPSGRGPAVPSADDVFRLMWQRRLPYALEYFDRERRVRSGVVAYLAVEGAAKTLHDLGDFIVAREKVGKQWGRLLNPLPRFCLPCHLRPPSIPFALQLYTNGI